MMICRAVCAAIRPRSRVLVLDHLHDGAKLEDLELSRPLVVGRLDPLVHPELLPRGALEGLLDRVDDQGLLDPLFLPQLGDNLSDIQNHRFLFPVPKSSSWLTSRFAFRTSR